MTPTTKSISDNIIAQLESSLNQTIPLMPKSFNRVLSKALAGVFVILYKYAEYTALQMFVRTASSRPTVYNGVTVTPLIELGRLVGVGDPTPAESAELTITIAVLNQVGVLNSGVQLIGATNGVTYMTTTAVNLNALSVTTTVVAISDQSGGDGSGVVGNLDVGQILSFANPIPNVSRDTSVDSQIVTGSDAEDLDVRYRRRVLDRFQKRPQGGAYTDYEQWGEEAPGVVNVYPYTGDPGQVNVYSEATTASSGNADGIPTTAQLQSVLDIINLDTSGHATRRNTNSFVNSLPITRKGFTATVDGVAGVADVAQLQLDITVALSEYFRAAEPFIPGLSIPPRVDQITQTRVSAIVEDIITAANGTFTVAIFNVTGVTGGLQIYILGEGEKAKLDNVIF